MEKRILSLSWVLLAMLGSVQAQTDFARVGQSPVLAVSPEGNWDSRSVGQPTILLEDGTYEMWYWGTDDQANAIGYATSTDGVHWTKYDGNPILAPGTDGEWDCGFIGEPCVIKTTSGYMMWYTGDDGSDRHKIGLATSVDGLHWQKYENNPVLEPGDSGSWDAKHVFAPTVLYEAGKYKMWYMGQDRSGGYYRIGCAVSEDGVNWRKVQANPVLDIGLYGSWEDGSVGAPCVLWQRDRYVMFYQGSGRGLHPGWQIGVAYSSDGVSWTKDPSNPVLKLGAPGSWDEAHLVGPAAILAGDQCMLWYSGSRDGGHWSIGLAESAPERTREYEPDAFTVALWHFDGDWQDASGNGHDLMVSGNPVFVSGCPEVEGSSEAVRPHNLFSVANPDLIYASDISYPGTGGWTIECWVKFEHLFETNPEKRGWMVQQYTQGIAGHEPFLLGIWDRKLYFHVQSSSNRTLVASADASPYVGRWVHVAGVFEPGGVKLYVNGRIVAEAQGDVIPETSMAPFYICSQWDYSHGHSYDFAIDEVRISNKARNPDEFAVPTTVSCRTSTNSVTRMFTLTQNYPNPFNQQTTISYDLRKDSQVSVAIYSLLGETVRVLQDPDERPAGHYTVTWDGRDQLGAPVPSGVYICRLRAGSAVQTRKMVLLR